MFQWTRSKLNNIWSKSWNQVLSSEYVCLCIADVTNGNNCFKAIVVMTGKAFCNKTIHMYSIYYMSNQNQRNIFRLDLQWCLQRVKSKSVHQNVFLVLLNHVNDIDSVLPLERWNCSSIFSGCFSYFKSNVCLGQP